MKKEFQNPTAVGADLSFYRQADKFLCECQKTVVADYWQEYASLMKEVDDRLCKIPPLYGQEKLGMNAVAYAHYFVAATDIFITECSGDDAFGYAILNGDYGNSEMGYFSLGELAAIPYLNLDFHWEPKPLREALREVDAEYFG